MSIEQRKIRQFRCTSCGGELELQNPRTRYVACPYCGSVADASSDAFHVLTKYANPSDFSPRSFLKLGKEAVLFGKAYKIIGRTRWRSTYTEQWYEDGETGYETGSWQYDEWLLISEDATYFYIIEDSDGFYFSFSIIPPYPSLPEGKHINDFYMSGRLINATEFGSSEILYFEGESTYLVKPGRKVGYSEYKSSSNLDTDSIYTPGLGSFIAEWRYNDEGKIQEIEFFREQKVWRGKLEYAFMTEEERMELEQRERAKLLEKQKVRKTNKRIFQIGGLINLFVGLFLLIMYSGSSYSYTPAFKQVFKYPVQADAKDFVQRDSSKVLIFKSDSVIRIEKSYKSVRVKIKPEIPAESDVLFRLKIFNKATGEPVFERSTYAYDYKQYKGDRVAFADGNFNEYFALNNAEGKYSVEFEMELPQYFVQKPSSGDKPKALVEISILKEYAPNGTLFFVFGVIMLIISLFIRIPKINK